MTFSQELCKLGTIVLISAPTLPYLWKRDTGRLFKPGKMLGEPDL